VIFSRGRVAEPRLELTDDEVREVRPVRGRSHLRFDVVRQRVVVTQGAGGVQVAGQQVVECGDVRRALDGGVAPQGQDAAAGPADVAEQELEDRGGTDHLYAGRVLGPADGVTDGTRAVRPGVVEQRLRHLQERGPRRAADMLDEFGCVAGEVPAEDLEDAA